MRIRSFFVLVGAVVGLTAACGGAVGGGSLFTPADGGNPPGCRDFARCVPEEAGLDARGDRVVVGRVPAKHRAAPATCDGVRPATEPTNVPDSGFGQCAKNADCTAGRNGRCVWARAGLVCTYDQCTTDGECGKNVCECSGGMAATDVCLGEGNCRVDDDCGAGGYCSPTLGSCGHYTGYVGYYCHTAQDECVDDEDCAGVDGGGFGRPYCAFERTLGRWRCSTQECAG
jgi:hypothetical protein